MTDLRLSKKLPNKPSKLIKVALNDLRQVLKKNDKYTIDMSYFYAPNGKCSMCLAGSVLVQRTNIKEIEGNFHDEENQLYLSHHLEDIQTGEESEEITDKLYAIDKLREGQVAYGFKNLGLEEEIGIDFNRRITPWHENEALFILELYKLSEDLRKAGY